VQLRDAPPFERETISEGELVHAADIGQEVLECLDALDQLLVDVDLSHPALSAMSQLNLEGLALHRPDPADPDNVPTLGLLLLHHPHGAWRSNRVRQHDDA